MSKIKEVFAPMRRLKVNKEIELYSNEHDVVTSGLITKHDNGFDFTYTKVDMNEPDKRKTTQILLTTEDGLDKEDLENVNEILQSEKLSFVAFK